MDIVVEDIPETVVETNEAHIEAPAADVSPPPEQPCDFRAELLLPAIAPRSSHHAPDRGKPGSSSQPLEAED
mgnify:CR=1 FL=1